MTWLLPSRSLTYIICCSFPQNLINENLSLDHLILIRGFSEFSLLLLFVCSVFMYYEHGPDNVLDSLVSWTTHFLISQIYSLWDSLDKYSVQCDKCSDMGSTALFMFFSSLKCPVLLVTLGICFFS